jgi:hypothetical protein
VELPAAIALLGSRVRLVLHLGDEAAHARSVRSFFLKALLTLLRARAVATIEERPLSRPEINPLLPAPESAQRAYEESWRAHLALVSAAWTYGT